MPYALFSHDAKLSRAYPTEADVWKLARKSGLVIDAESEPDKPGPHPILDNDYEIRPCTIDPQEDSPGLQVAVAQHPRGGQHLAEPARAERQRGGPHDPDRFRRGRHRPPGGQGRRLKWH